MVTLSNSPTTSKRKFEKAAVNFGVSVHDAERVFLYASWHDPVQMLTVACDLGLDHSSFSDPEAQFIFCYLGSSAEFGRQNTISIVECVRMARAEGLLVLPTSDLELADDIILERAEFPGDITTEIRPRGEILKQAVLNRDEAQRYFKAICDLIGDRGLDELLSDGRRKPSASLLRGKVLA